MTTELHIVYEGAQSAEREDFYFDDDHEPEFTDETLFYDGDTDHWVVQASDRPSYETADWPDTGSSEATPTSIRIPRGRVYSVSRTKPYDRDASPEPVEPTPPTETLVAQLVHEVHGGADVLDNRRSELLERPRYDRETDHWTCRFHDLDEREADGTTYESTRFVPRERVYHVFGDESTKPSAAGEFINRGG